MRSRSGELSASMAVLALLAEQPDSQAGVNRRLAERYPGARFADNSAHKSLPSLESQGLVRRAAALGERPLDVYEATVKGVELVERWLYDSSAALPALRDELRARLQHVREPAGLPAMVEAIEAQEQTCAGEYVAAQKRLRAAQRQRKPAGDGGWREVVEIALMRDEAILWGSLALRRKRMREYLEDPAGMAPLGGVDDGG